MSLDLDELERRISGMPLQYGTLAHAFSVDEIRKLIALARPPVLPADLAELVSDLRHCVPGRMCLIAEKAAAAIEALVRERDEAQTELALVEHADDLEIATGRERAETAEREAAALRAAIQKIIDDPLTIAASPDVIFAVQDLHYLICETLRAALAATERSPS